ncbi:MAG: UDP-N-acetylmuramate dehydrogenase [Candidatus Dormibacteria bacterium]
MSSRPLPASISRLLRDELEGGYLRQDEPLGRHSQFGVGGPADWYWEPVRPELLPELVGRAREEMLPLLVLGAGSNCLIRDGGIRGLVLKFPARRATRLEGGGVLLTAGAMLPRAAFDTAYWGLRGLAFGVGIPGTLGAAAAGNAGAFGGEMAQVLEEVEVVLPDGRRQRLPVEGLEAGYRRTSLQRGPMEGAVVTWGRLRLEPSSPELAKAEVHRVMRERKRSQPTGVRSLGSTFKNPVGTTAGRLIEEAGLKGLRRGQAQVSEAHANFICNLGGATSGEVLALIALIRQRVRQRCGVELELEVIPVGGPVLRPRPS